MKNSSTMEYVKRLNQLIVKYHLPVPCIKNIQQIRSLVIIHLFSALFGYYPKGIVRTPITYSDDEKNLNLVISELSRKILNKSLNHISVQRILKNVDILSLHHLLGIFELLSQMQQAQISPDTTGSIEDTPVSSPSTYSNIGDLVRHNVSPETSFTPSSSQTGSPPKSTLSTRETLPSSSYEQVKDVRQSGRRLQFQTVNQTMYPVSTETSLFESARQEGEQETCVDENAQDPILGNQYEEERIQNDYRTNTTEQSELDSDTDSSRSSCSRDARPAKSERRKKRMARNKKVHFNKDISATGDADGYAKYNSEAAKPKPTRKVAQNKFVTHSKNRFKVIKKSATNDADQAVGNRSIKKCNPRNVSSRIILHDKLSQLSTKFVPYSSWKSRVVTAACVYGYPIPVKKTVVSVDSDDEQEFLSSSLEDSSLSVNEDLNYGEVILSRNQQSNKSLESIIKNQIASLEHEMKVALSKKTYSHQQNQKRRIKNFFREHQQHVARMQHYYEDYFLAQQSRLLNTRAKEEMQLRRLHDDAKFLLKDHLHTLHRNITDRRRENLQDHGRLIDDNERIYMQRLMLLVKKLKYMTESEDSEIEQLEKQSYLQAQNQQRKDIKSEIRRLQEQITNQLEGDSVVDIYDGIWRTKAYV